MGFSGVTQWNCRRKEFHNGGAVLRNSVRLGSSRSRLWQRTCCGITDKWRWCHKSVSSLPCGLWGQKRLIVISCHRFVVGPVVFTFSWSSAFHCLSAAQVAQPNLEIGQNSNSTSLNICETFPKNDGLRDAFLGQAQTGGGSARAGPSSGETGGGRREKRPRRHSAPGGRAGDFVSGQRGRTERADCHRVQDVLVPGSESVAETMAEAGRLYHESAGAIKSKPEAERADAEEQPSPPYVHVAFLRSLAATSWLAPEHVAVLKSYWESNVVKSPPVHVRHSRAKPCKKIEGKEGWTRIVFCLDPVTLTLEGALEAALHLQKGVRKFSSAPRGPLERDASMLLTQMRGKKSVWRTKWHNTVYTWLGSCVVGCWSHRWCMPS